MVGGIHTRGLISGLAESVVEWEGPLETLAQAAPLWGPRGGGPNSEQNVQLAITLEISTYIAARCIIALFNCVDFMAFRF